MLPMSLQSPALFDAVVKQHGAVDALVNTVGGYAGGVKLWDLETSVLDRMLGLNLRSGFALARAALRYHAEGRTRGPL